MALVSQETFLFNDTVRKNIAYGRPNASEDEILRASKAAHVDSFVMDFEDGYSTIIGERGVKLSGGQRQRVMIAMALANKPDFLIADEPTTALDVTVQAQVLDLIKRLQAQLGMSVLLITHDLGSVHDHADRVAVMTQGELVECGDTEQVFTRP